MSHDKTIELAQFNRNENDNDHAETVNQKEVHQSKCTEVIKELRQWSGFMVLSIIFIIGISVVLGCYNHFPKPKSSSIPLSEFSEDRAYQYLEYMINIGVRRNLSSRNRTAHYIYQQFLNMKQQSSYDEFISVGITNSLVGYVPPAQHFLNYTVNDVWVYVNFTQKSDSDYILVSGHFDTQPKTVGCNDDALSTATIMELVSVYTSLSINDVKKYNYNILMVTIDGEEAGKFR